MVCIVLLLRRPSGALRHNCFLGQSRQGAAELFSEFMPSGIWQLPILGEWFQPIRPLFRLIRPLEPLIALGLGFGRTLVGLTRFVPSQQVQENHVRRADKRHYLLDSSDEVPGVRTSTNAWSGWQTRCTASPSAYLKANSRDELSPEQIEHHGHSRAAF